jgi:hypothetical protein
MSYRNHSERINHLRVLSRQLQYLRSASEHIGEIIRAEEEWANAHGNAAGELLIETLNQLRIDLRRLDVGHVIDAVTHNLYPAAARA